MSDQTSLILTSLILIVDDNPNNVKVLFEVLELAGFRTLIAKSGEDALEALEFTEPDLILLDIMMPGINGFETCARIKSNPKTQEIPIIFMTAQTDNEHKITGLNAGAVDYITKPFQQEEVLARIKIHLELYQLRRSLEQKVAERTAALTAAMQQLQKAQRELQHSQLQLVQHEKMSALGNLVAGVAHEINNPVNFIAGNIDHALRYVEDLFRVIDLYQRELPNPSEELDEELDAINLAFVRQDLPKLIQSMEEGADRIFEISRSLRIFSRSDAENKQRFNIHDGIDSTLLILRHRLKANEHRPEIKILKNYSDLPSVSCYPGQLNQVFMNLLANAIDALEESDQNDAIHQITIATESLIDTVKIHIQDNGIGIPERIKQRIFESQFTTKPVGKGTGLGLAIAHQIITEKHQGSLSCSSVSSQGTTFTIELPIES